MKKEHSHHMKAHHKHHGEGPGMAYAGVDQGDMAPHVKDYQTPEKDFSQRGFSKTLDYIERQDRFRGKESKEVESQAYQGRYS